MLDRVEDIAVDLRQYFLDALLAALLEPVRLTFFRHRPERRQLRSQVEEAADTPLHILVQFHRERTLCTRVRRDGNSDLGFVQQLGHVTTIFSQPLRRARVR